MGIMGGKGGGKNALAAKPNLLSALRVQTSSYGQVIPIVYGQNRIAARLIWAGDFQAIPHTSDNQSRRQRAGLRRRKRGHQYHVHVSNRCRHGLMPRADPEYA